MPGIAKDLQVSEIHQAPGDLWVIGTAPLDATPRLTLATDGTPEAAAHPGSVHLGATQSAITTMAKPVMAPIELDQHDGPFDSYATDLRSQLEAEMAQTEMAKLQRGIGVATYATGAGYKQVTFGGSLVVPTLCVAAISAKRTNALRHIVSMLFKAAAVGGFSVSFGRAASSKYKLTFLGLHDPVRTAGKQVGIVYETLVDAAGLTPTAKSFNVNEIFQGPADFWLIDPAPTDAAQRVTLDAATLTPDSVTHAASKHLGGTDGPVTLTVLPKIGEIRMDQLEGVVDVFVQSIEAKLEAEMSQTEMLKLSRALAIGDYLLSAGAYAQVTFGGKSQPPTFCVAAVAPKRTDGTKALVGCLFKVNSVEGLLLTMSRKTQSKYKVTFTGLLDLARTSGRQMGIVHEMI